jgi:hypothetical protein
MKEGDLERAADLSRHKSAVRYALKKTQEHGEGIVVIDAENVFGSCPIRRLNLIRFLEGEIQSLNLELHTLGVELPGVHRKPDGGLVIEPSEG